jgi:DNA-directed RNA polymerase specialized sigma24 family protein
MAEADVARLVAMYAEGATTYELAAKFGCHRATVAATLRRAGVERDGSRRLRLDDALLDQVTALRDLGLSIREIARRTGVSRTKVDRYLSRAKDTNQG